jgi:hypothetical protein
MFSTKQVESLLYVTMETLQTLNSQPSTIFELVFAFTGIFR